MKLSRRVGLIVYGLLFPGTWNMFFGICLLSFENENDSGKCQVFHITAIALEKSWQYTFLSLWKFSYSIQKHQLAINIKIIQLWMLWKL